LAAVAIQMLSRVSRLRQRMSGVATAGKPKRPFRQQRAGSGGADSLAIPSAPRRFPDFKAVFGETSK